MILEIIAGIFLAGLAVAILEDIIFPWARRVITSVANAVSSVLYAVGDVLDAVFTIYVNDGYEAVRESKRIPLNELPADIQAELNRGKRIKVAMGN